MMTDIVARVRAELEGAWAVASGRLGPRVATPYVAVERGDGAVVVTANVVPPEILDRAGTTRNTDNPAPSSLGAPRVPFDPLNGELRSVPVQVRFRERAQIHVVTNDLRHRCNAQRVFGRDCIVGHHSFESTDTHFEQCLRALVLSDKWC
jgi:hypothetical protein